MWLRVCVVESKRMLNTVFLTEERRAQQCLRVRLRARHRACLEPLRGKLRETSF